MAERSKSKTTSEHSHGSVKDLFLSDQRRWEELAEQRRRSIGELSTSAIVNAIQSLDLVGEKNERVINDRIILQDLFLALAERDPSKMLEMAKELPDEYDRIAILKAFPYLAKENPEFLQSYVLTSDFEAGKDRWMMLAACQYLGEGNPGKAVILFDEMSEERKQSNLGTMLLQHAASKESALVVDFLTERRNSPYFIDSFRHVLYTVLVNDPGFAIKLASSYPEVQETNLSAGIYTSMARKDPKWAIKEMAVATPVVRLEILTRPTRDNSTYFSELFSEDPERTIKLLNGIVPSTANSNLFQEAADRLSSLPAGTVRDTSVRSFAEVIRPSDPETADRWIESLR